MIINSLFVPFLSFPTTWSLSLRWNDGNCHSSLIPSSTQVIFILIFFQTRSRSSAWRLVVAPSCRSLPSYPCRTMDWPGRSILTRTQNCSFRDSTSKHLIQILRIHGQVEAQAIRAHYVAGIYSMERNGLECIMFLYTYIETQCPLRSRINPCIIVRC